MQAGNLNRRITIQQKVSGVDSWGQPVDDWKDLAKVWAWFKAPTGRGTLSAEFQAESGEVSRAQYSIRIRYREDVTAKMRVVDTQGRIYDIRQVIPDVAGREYVDLVVGTGANNG